MDVDKAVILKAVDEKVGVACRNLEEKGKKEKEKEKENFISRQEKKERSVHKYGEIENV